MKTLTTGVDSGVGAPAAMCFEGGVKYLAERGFDNILDAQTTWLALPSIEVGTIVSAYAFPSHARMLAKGVKDARLGYEYGA
jgi:hypothetical protein